MRDVHISRLAETPDPRDPTQVPDSIKDDIGKTPGDFIDENEEDGDDDDDLEDDGFEADEDENN